METTLSGRTYVRLFREAIEAGYEIELHYLWLESAQQAVDRVRMRVQMGGHNVSAMDIRRRFGRSREHLLNDYIHLATRWMIWDTRRILTKKTSLHRPRMVLVT